MNEKLSFIVAHYRTYIGQEHVLCYKKKKNFQWIVDFQVTRFLMIDCWLIERISAVLLILEQEVHFLMLWMWIGD